jgi:leader peptidase (prepilin peptidase)/N-methyltransferase
MAVSYAAIVAVWGVTAASLLLIVFASFSIILAAIDIDVQRLPNVLVATLSCFVLGFVTVEAIVTGEWNNALRALIGAAAVGLLYGLAFVIYPKGLGFGDVKLAPALGAILGWFGWGELAVGTFAGFLWGAVFGAIVMASTKRLRDVRIPFGPWMLLGAWTGIFVGDAIGDWYTSVVIGI